MKVIGFLGYSEKIDLVTSLSKLLNIMGKTVLVIDATLDKKYKYVIPTLEVVEKAYVTQFDNVDYAVGFDSLNDVENYLCEQKINVSLYDYMIIDIDNSQTYEFFRSRVFNKIFFVTDTSMLSYKKNLEILNSIKIYNTSEASDAKISKVLYRQYMTRTGEKYFENALNAMQANWDDREYEIVETEQDMLMYLDFQISGIISIRKLSKYFQINLIDMASQLLEDTDTYTIKKAIKKGGV